jgi:hypothetical protein
VRIQGRPEDLKPPTRSNIETRCCNPAKNPKTIKNHMF